MKEYIINLEFHVSVRDIEQERRAEIKKINDEERQESNRLMKEIQQKRMAAYEVAQKNKKGSE